MAFEELSKLEAISGSGDLSALELARLNGNRQEARDAAEAKRAQEEKAGALQARLEAEAHALREFGDFQGGLSSAMQRAAEAADEVTDLHDKLQKAEAKLSRARSNVEFFAQRSQQAHEFVSRMVVPPPDSLDPVEQATRQAHRVFRETTRALLADVAATSGPRPFARSGDAARGKPVAGRGREITRVCTGEGMRQLGTLYGEAVR